MSVKVIWVLFVGVVVQTTNAQNKLYIVHLPSVNDGYETSWKSAKSTQHDTVTVDNPDSNDPNQKYLVKSTVKVREKLPYVEATVGYDREYQYPIAAIDHEYHKNEKVVDFSSAQSDPFPGVHYVNEQPKKPKKIAYSYQYPSNQNEYQKNFQLVNAYIADVKPGKKKQNIKQESRNKPKEYHYQYPVDDYQFQKNVNLVDSYIKNKDSNAAPAPKKQQGQKKQPKNYNYHYQYPSDDYEYHKNAHIVDFYTDHDNNYGEPKKSDEYGYNGDHDSDKYQSYFDNPGPSSDYEYARYKTEGPDYDYLASDYSNVEEKKVPSRN